jgi:hypothetical protein
MLTLSRWKIIAVTLSVIFGILFSLPNVLPQKTLDAMPGWLPHQKLNLGLDLQGGSYLLLMRSTPTLCTASACRIWWKTPAPNCAASRSRSANWRCRAKWSMSASVTRPATTTPSTCCARTSARRWPA